MTAALPVAPSTTTELAEVVRDAAARRTPLRIVGAGTWLDANRPVRASAALSTIELNGIVEYEPGDLTLTARAGTSLGAIAGAVAAHGQWLTLDPFGDAAGTLGATLATASAGPLAHAFGTPRDLALGLEFVTGTGAIARGGGRVVKNVAGFDLTRLLTGSWGALGVITEVTVRLRARPEVDETLAVAVADGAASLGALAAWLRAAPFAPLAFELLDAPLAARLELRHDGPIVLARIGGNETAVRAQRSAVRSLGDARRVGDGMWAALRAAEPARAAVVRLSALPSRFAATWDAANAIARAGGEAFVHGTPGRGVARVVVRHDATDDADALRDALARPTPQTRVYERLPDRLWPLLAPSPVADRLSRSITLAYDPHRILNPGILGEVEQ